MYNQIFIEKKIDQINQPFILPDLPYNKNSLSPYISQATLEFHHDKHHQTYVDNLNNFIKSTEFENKSLTDIIMITNGDSNKASIFNNAAQVWNHSFYWNCMKPSGGSLHTEILNRINHDFGSFDKFKEEFKSASLSQFGSGWSWLVISDDKLKIVKTSNAGTPIVNNEIPLITCDVWEHAYYLDYQNKRASYVDVFLDNLVNWDFVEEIINNISK